ncbi:hypothetical protein CDAR_611741 [Caerostris darwini]|uniref:Uncharacterized protein n=1 Tax=Caerostris darwini TaxID=1538125 RepID=A0AAV4U2Q7_9ARAC|nr:hypothetical protein CDAR_611741 [Caerostris darwini]
MCDDCGNQRDPLMGETRGMAGNYSDQKYLWDDKRHHLEDVTRRMGGDCSDQKDLGWGEIRMGDPRDLLMGVVKVIREMCGGYVDQKDHLVDSEDVYLDVVERGFRTTHKHSCHDSNLKHQRPES